LRKLERRVAGIANREDVRQFFAGEYLAEVMARGLDSDLGPARLTCPRERCRRKTQGEDRESRSQFYYDARSSLSHDQR
jgi:hypothetical protein